ncbi:MAG: hypothetical protein RR614_08330, partial [Eubacterium sp.]
MWLRQDLKQKGKKAFKANYWASVVAALFATVGAGMTFFNSTSGQNEMQDAMDAVTADQMAAFFGTSE